MNPRAAAATKQKTDTRTSPFEQIMELEQQEEQRLNAALEKLREEEVEAEKAMLEAEKHEEEKLREEAKKELIAFKDTIGKELSQNEKQIAADVEKLESASARQMPGVVEEQVQAFLSLAS